MAIDFQKTGGLNDDLWDQWSTLLVSTMVDADKEKNPDDELVKALYNVKKSRRFGEKAAGVTAFSDFDYTPEGEDGPDDTLQESEPKLITHTPFMKSFTVTAEMMEDNAMDPARLAAANYVRAYKRSRAGFASAALVSSGTKFTYGSKTDFDRTTADGKALFDMAHTGTKSGVSAQSNVFTNAFGEDDTVLNRLANIGRNFQNASGHVIGYTFDTIVIPGNCPRLEALCKKIVNSDQQVGGNFNDVNVNKGMWKLVVNHRWTVTEGEPFILMSSQANKELNGSVFYDRLPLTMVHEVLTKSQNMVWSGRCRFSAGFYNWRHVLMGGAKTGTTLTV